MPDYRAMAREAAQRAGIDPDVFERQIEAESNFDPDAVSPAGALGIAQIVPEFHPDVDPRDPAAALEYAARWMATLHQRYGRYDLALAAYNAGPGNVDRYGPGVPPFEETHRYLTKILGPDWVEPRAAPASVGRYNPDLPTEFQVNSWTCSIRSCAWLVKSLGVETSAETLHDLMVPRFVNEELGLLDASGAGLAQFIRDQFALPARHDGDIRWEELPALCNGRPAAIGGRAWCHWVAVRRVNERGELELANPSRGGYRGVDSLMNAQQFAELGPFSAVWIDLPGESPPLPEGRQFRVARLEGSRLNLRESPGTSAAVVGSLEDGAVVEGREWSWRYVRGPGGVAGWVANEFLDPLAGAAGAPARPGLLSVPGEPAAQPRRRRGAAARPEAAPKAPARRPAARRRPSAPPRPRRVG